MKLVIGKQVNCLKCHYVPGMPVQLYYKTSLGTLFASYTLLIRQEKAKSHPIRAEQLFCRLPKMLRGKGNPLSKTKLDDTKSPMRHVPLDANPFYQTLNAKQICSTVQCHKLKF